MEADCIYYLLSTANRSSIQGGAFSGTGYCSFGGAFRLLIGESSPWGRPHSNLNGYFLSAKPASLVLCQVKGEMRVKG